MAQHRETRLARVRSRYTGERHTDSLQGIRDFGLTHGLVPAAADAEQELLEARVVHALVGALGAHCPAQHGGPFGLASASPQPLQLVLRIAAPAVADVVSALLTWQMDDGEWVGRSGLHGLISDDGRQLVLRHPQLQGTVVMLADLATPDRLQEALSALPAPPSLFDDPAALFEPGMPLPVERDLRRGAAAWSTALRRLGLLTSALTVDFTGGPPTLAQMAGPEPALLPPPAPNRPVRTGRRYLLTPELEELLDGRSLRGIVYQPDLWTWLYEQRSPTGYCDWCDEPVDARTEDTAVQVTMTAYDPDLCPATQMLASKLFHPRCKSSGVNWARRADLDSSPTAFDLAVDGHEDKPGGYRWVVRPVVLWDCEDDPAAADDDGGQATLVFIGQVIETHGEPARAWYDALGMYLRGQGFTPVDGVGGADGYAVRVVDGEKPWVAVRQPSEEDTPVEHFWLGRFDPSLRWLELARRNCQVLLIAGADPSDEGGLLARSGPIDAERRVDAVLDELEDLLADGGLLVSRAGLVPDRPA